MGEIIPMQERSAGQAKAARPRRVAIHGLQYFSSKLASILKDPGWEISHHFYLPSRLPRFVADLWRSDLAFTWGGRISMGRFLQTAQVFGKKNVVILWCGSDLLLAQDELAAGKMDSWVAERVHWAASPALADEVRALGLSCEYVQVSFVQPVASPPPLPEKFSVLVYVPTLERSELYGLDRILEVAEALPRVEFTLVGLQQGETLRSVPNLKIHNRVSPLTPFIERASVIWRPVRHDAGTSFMVLEALAQGRHVLYTYPFSSCIQVSSAGEARLELERLLALHESKTLRLNESGIRAIAEAFTPECVRANLFRRWAEIIDGVVDGQKTETVTTAREASIASARQIREKTGTRSPLHQQP